MSNNFCLRNIKRSGLFQAKIHQQAAKFDNIIHLFTPKFSSATNLRSVADPNLSADRFLGNTVLDRKLLNASFE
jgi:hypothetical protein